VKRKNVKRRDVERKAAFGAESLCFLVIGFFGASIAHAAGFEASLSVSQGNTRQSTKTAATTRGALERRVQLAGPPGARFTATWKMTRTAKDQADDVLVHFYVVKLDRPGEAPPPLDPNRVVIESALTMDFPSGEAASANQPFRIDEPGVYLVRIEIAIDTQHAAREDYAEMELVVK